MFMSQKGELKLPGVTQGPEVRGCDLRWPDSGVCVLGPEAELLGLPTTLEPATGRPRGAGCRAHLVQAGAPEGGSEVSPFLGPMAVLPWSAQTGAGEGWAREGPGPGCVQRPSRAPGPCPPER